MFLTCWLENVFVICHRNNDVSRCGYQVPSNSCCIVQAQNTRAATEMGSMFVNKSSPSICLLRLCTQCLCPAPSSSSVALPWRGACGAVPISRPSPGFPQLEMCRRLDCGIWGHGSLPVHLHSHPGSALNSCLLPVLSYGGHTGGNMLNTMHPVLGNFSRFCLSGFRFF